MKLKSIIKVLFNLSIFSLFILLISCGNDAAVNPQGNYMGGTVTFTNANLNYTGGYYAISFYGDSASPFTKAPIKSDSLAISTSGGVTSSYYKESNLATGDYYVAATWISNSSGNVYALGTYGCDTVAGCTAAKVTFPNYAGTGTINIKSYTNISNALFYYHHP